MEGFLLAVHVSDSGGKRPWQTDFVKFDDISAQLLGFTDRSQAELKWKLHLKDADVATPVPGDRKHDHAPNLDETPHCFYAHEVTSCGHEVLVFLAAPDDDTKKKWMKCLLQAAKDGPHPPIFSGALSPRAAAAGSCPNPLPPFWFEARVTQVRLHSDGKHAEYMVTCHVSLFSRVADRRLNKEWNVWHRFSEFDQLNEALKLSLGAEKMAVVPFHKTHRDAIRSLFGWWSLDQDFLDQRRLLLDTFVTRVCAIEGVTEFFQGHSEQNLKKFLEFDEHCEDVDHSPRKHSPTKAPRKHSSDKHSSSEQQDAAPEPPRRDSHAMLRTSDMSPRDSDHESASFSSAIMSPIAAATPTKAVEAAAPPAPAPPSPSEKKKKNKKAIVQEAPAQQVEVAVAPVVDDVSATTKPAGSGSPRRNSRKKGKGKDTTPTEPVEKESCAAAVATSEAVRGAAPTSGNGGKKGKNKKN